MCFLFFILIQKVILYKSYDENVCKRRNERTKVRMKERTKEEKSDARTANA